MVQRTSKSMSLFVATPNNSLKSKTTSAEAQFCNFTAEHNIPFAVADHFTQLCKKMFTDSEIPKGFSCGGTKTTQIVKRAIAPSLNEDVINKMQSQPFSIMCEESNDQGGDKNFVILAKLFDDDLGKTVTIFVEMPVVNIGTAVNLFNSLNKTLADRNIPWQNVFGVVSDNCSVMKGERNSVMSKIKEQQPNLFDIGCICHLANLCCVAAVKVLSLPIEELIIDVYYHFQHSAKRKEEYKEFLEFNEVDYLKIIKHVSTRWLSLQKCISRTLHHWPALQSYFKSYKDNEKEGRIKRASQHLDSAEMKLYFNFLEFIMVPLNEFNTAFQADAARIGILADQMRRLLRKFLGKFVKNAVIAASSDVTAVPYEDFSAQLSNELMAVGTKNRTYLVEFQDHIGIEVEQNFFRAVRRFYETIISKMLQKFPFADSILKDIGFINPPKKHSFTADNVLNLVKRFPGIVLDDETDMLVEQFSDYQLSPLDDLPSCVTDDNI